MARLGSLPRAFLYIALVAWATAFVGFALDLLRRVGVSKA